MHDRKYLYTNKIALRIIKAIDLVLEIFSKKTEEIINRDVKNILIIKSDHMGDVLMVTAVLPLIRNRYPCAWIDIVIGEWSEDILRDNPFIRTKYIVNHAMNNRSGESLFSKCVSFVGTYLNSLVAVRKCNYDLCINLRYYSRNLMSFAWLSNSKYIIGYGTAGFGPVLNIEVGYVEDRHEIEQYLAVLKPLGINAELSGLSYKLYCTEKDEDIVNNTIKKYALKDFVIIHPGSGAADRMLPNKYWADLIEKLPAQHIVICGTKNEIRIFDEIKRLCGKNIIDLIDCFTVQQLYLFYKRADLIYCLESLSSHIAAMTGNKVIAFYTCDPLKWKPLGGDVRIIRDADAYLNSITLK
jgi:ADP-heptose:LPS heptosyltransferase